MEYIDIQTDNSFLLELIECLPSHVFWKNKEGVYLGCNFTFARSLGLSSPKDVVGKTDYELPVRQKDSNLYRLDDQYVMESQQSKLNIIEEQTLLSGKKVFLLTSKVPLYDSNNQVEGIIGSYSDITELKETQLALLQAKEIAEKASQAKTEFLENMRHDLRTPLSNIVGLSEILCQKIEDPELKSLAKDLHSSSQHLNYLINEVLKLSEFSISEVALQLQIFSFDDLLASIYALLKVSIDKKPAVIFNISIDPCIPKKLFGPYQAYRTVLMNLIDNALKFTEKGEVSVSLKLVSQQEDDLNISIEVYDTGIGIPKEKQDVIFNKFEVANPSCQVKSQGSGVGLFIVKQYIEAISASMQLKSQLGEGTRFILKTCVRNVCLQSPDEEGVKQNAISLQPVEIKPKAQQSVLIIEDNLIAQKVMSLMFSELTVSFRVAGSGKEALQLIKTDHFDLIFLDIGLPDISGFDVCRKIRSFEIKSKRISVPIIVLTAHVGASDVKQCMLAGAQQVIVKPLLQEKAKELLSDWSKIE